MHYAKPYQEILSRISRTHSPSGSHPQLIAVSKRQPIEAIEALYQLGHRDFGENYVQELCEKATLFHSKGYSGLRWHFIGHLQTNKVKTLLPFVDSIHTLDSLKLATEVNKRWGLLGSPKPLPVFIEINIDEEPSKSGIAPQSLSAFIQELKPLEHLHLQGLMCIPSPDKDPRPRFKKLRELELLCRPLSHGMLSMGMSDDFELAIEEGSTHLRVGTALFGSRSQTL